MKNFLIFLLVILLCVPLLSTLGVLDDAKEIVDNVGEGIFGGDNTTEAPDEPAYEFTEEHKPVVTLDGTVLTIKDNSGGMVTVYNIFLDGSKATRINSAGAVTTFDLATLTGLEDGHNYLVLVGGTDTNGSFLLLNNENIYYTYTASSSGNDTPGSSEVLPAGAVNTDTYTFYLNEQTNCGFYTDKGSTPYGDNVTYFFMKIVKSQGLSSCVVMLSENVDYPANFIEIRGNASTSIFNPAPSQISFEQKQNVDEYQTSVKVDEFVAISYCYKENCADRPAFLAELEENVFSQDFIGYNFYA